MDETKATYGLEVRSRADWEPVFLETLALTGNISRACKLANIVRSTFYRLRNTDKEFRAEVRRAFAEANDALELEARRRAHEGVDVPVIYKGEMCGVWVGIAGEIVPADTPGAKFVPLTLKEYSDALLILLLKAYRPKRFRENKAIEHTGPKGGPVRFAFQEVIAALQKAKNDSGRDG